MATRGKAKTALLWAVGGAVLSLFIYHRPPNPNDPLDRVAARLLVFLVSGVLGGIAGFIWAALRRPDEIKASHSRPVTTDDSNREQPQPLSPSPPTAEEIQQLGVFLEGSKYRYQTYLYDKLEDAISYARLDHSRNVQHHPPKERPSAPQFPQTDEMRALGVSFNGSKYQYSNYQYDRIEDALSYARLDITRTTSRES